MDPNRDEGDRGDKSRRWALGVGKGMRGDGMESVFRFVIHQNPGLISLFTRYEFGCAINYEIRQTT